MYLVDCNQAAVRMIGATSKEELLALRPNIADVSPTTQPDGRSTVEGVMTVIEELKKGNQLRFEWVHKSLDDRPLYVEVQAAVSLSPLQCR